MIGLIGQMGGTEYEESIGGVKGDLDVVMAGERSITSQSVLRHGKRRDPPWKGEDDSKG